MTRIMRFIGNNPEPEQEIYGSIQDAIRARDAFLERTVATQPAPVVPVKVKRRYRHASLRPRKPRPIVEPFETNLMEPLVGWRAWHVKNGRLTSLFQGVEFWLPEKPFHARCVPKICAHCPTMNHTCGIYAKNNFGQVREFLAHGEACGIVLGWGRYVRGVDGWRSEFAYPARILIARDSLHDLEKLKDYHVPLYVMEPMRLYDPSEDGYEYWNNEEDWSFGTSAESHAQEGAGQDQED